MDLLDQFVIALNGQLTGAVVVRAPSFVIVAACVLTILVLVAIAMTRYGARAKK